MISLGSQNNPGGCAGVGLATFHSSVATGGKSGPLGAATGALRGALPGFGRGNGAAASRAPRACGIETGGRTTWPSNGLNARGAPAAGPQQAKVRTAQHAITVFMSL